jgi:hypothetical protein
MLRPEQQRNTNIGLENMGLDMYAYTTNAAIAEVDFESPANSSEIFYRRKHPNLHGWMESLYRARAAALTSSLTVATLN